MSSSEYYDTSKSPEILSFSDSLLSVYISKLLLTDEKTIISFFPEQDGRESTCSVKLPNSGRDLTLSVYKDIKDNVCSFFESHNLKKSNIAVFNGEFIYVIDDDGTLEGLTSMGRFSTDNRDFDEEL